MKRFIRHSLMVAFFAGSLALPGCSKPDENGTDKLYQEIKASDKMVLASMAITKTARTERDNWYKVGKRIAVYSYDTYLQAYIDLSALKPEDFSIDEDKKTAIITLPPIKTEFAGRDMEMKKVYENIGILRSDIDARERAELKEKANDSLIREVDESPMFRQRLETTAKIKAVSYFQDLMASRGYKATVVFPDSDSENDDLHLNTTIPER